MRGREGLEEIYSGKRKGYEGETASHGRIPMMPAEKGVGAGNEGGWNYNFDLRIWQEEKKDWSKRSRGLKKRFEKETSVLVERTFGFLEGIKVEGLRQPENLAAKKKMLRRV